MLWRLDHNLAPYALASAAELPTTVLLPAAICSIAEVTVGPGEAAHLRKTLPWRLEESLLVSPDSLHFAHGEVVQGRVAVTLTDMAALEHVRQRFVESELPLQAACSELSLVPWQSGQWTLWLHELQGSTVLVRSGWHQGFACELSNLAATLTLLHNEQQAWPEAIVCYGTQQQFEAVHRLLPPTLQSQLVLRKPPSWEQLLESAPCNVMQGRFAPPLPWSRWWQVWRWPAYAAVALLVLDAAAVGLSTLQLRAMQAAVQAQIVEEFRRVQPEGALVDPLLQLQQLVSQGGDHHLMPLLTHMAAVLKTQQQVAVDQLDFDGSSGALQLDVRAQALANIEALRSGLQNAGLAVELLGSSSEGNSSRARLKVVQP